YPVQVLWQREDETSQVVVVGPYPLFVSSFKTLRATKWLVDEESVRQICAVVAKALFDGQIQKLGKIFNMTQKAMFVIDPMGAELAYAATLYNNWGLFLRMVTRKDQIVQWKMYVLNHSKQQDSSSCGVLILMFAKEYLESRSINNVKTSPEAILDARLQIACTLLEYKGTEHREVEQAEQKTMLDGRRQTRRQPEEDASDFLIVDELEWTFI
ncbi:hypothetical protein AB205_0171730, partial [Aquarana catesbeiana]